MLEALELQEYERCVRHKIRSICFHECHGPQYPISPSTKVVTLGTFATSLTLLQDSVGLQETYKMQVIN